MRVNFFLAGAGLVLLAGCGGAGDGEPANETNSAVPGAAADAAGNRTIAAGLDPNGRFMQAAKASGLDATLAGPGPYTVLVPNDAAFAKLPAGTLENLAQPQQRARLTDVLTYHILPGAVFAEDIARAIDNAGGRAILATMGGETLTAAREGERIVLTDGAGGRSAVVQADQRRSNGVVHVVDGVLMPAAGEGAAAAPAGAPR
jgi:uncharacterized surface protein with fasciclin (FAS1) repeats